MKPMKKIKYLAKPSDFFNSNTIMFQINYSSRITFAVFSSDFAGIEKIANDKTVAVFKVQRKGGIA